MATGGPKRSRGRTLAVLADERALIETDATRALVFYNETYRRKAP